MPTDLTAALAVFDVASLEILANKGLVRRAMRDLDEGKVSLVGSDDQAARVIADGEAVNVDVRGPAHAQCSCPAPGLCRHRIAATLFLQALARAPIDALAPAVDHEGALKAELAAIDAAHLAKWAGKAAWQAARELADQGGTVAVQGAALAIGVGGEDVRFLAGQGLTGMASKAPPAKAKFIHAAAVLLARRHLGLETVSDDPLVAPAEPEQRQIDPAFLVEIGRVLEQCARLALNLAPVAVEDQLFVLSVSSRADHLPRLSRMLRTLSTMLRDRRNREFAFDPDRCLALIAEAYALAGALGREANLADPVLASALCGAIRQDYAPTTGPLALQGMGADVWRTQAGARGITLHLYDGADDRWLSATLARSAGQDPGFEPLLAYNRDAVWHGQTIDRLSRSRFSLIDAAVSPDGRLSLAGAVRAVDLAEDAPPEGLATTRWGDLRDRLRQALATTIDAPHRAIQPVLLQPRRVAKPWFDDLRQMLVWPVEDEDGLWLELTVEHGRDRNALGVAIEAVAERGWRGTITALASIGDQSFTVKPIALRDGTTMVNLGLDDVGALTKPGVAATAALFVRDFSKFLGATPRKFHPAPASRPRQTLAVAWQSLIDLAELGMTALSHEQAAQIARSSEALRRIGLSVIADTYSRVGAVSGQDRWQAHLAAVFAIHQARRQTLDLPLLVRA